MSSPNTSKQPPPGIIVGPKSSTDRGDNDASRSQRKTGYKSEPMSCMKPRRRTRPTGTGLVPRRAEILASAGGLEG